MKKYVFVYGSLKKNFYNHNFIKNSKFIKSSQIEGYTMKYSESRRFPYLFDNGKYIVLGEIYEIDNETLKRLDALEGQGQIYNRKEILIDGLNCYLYLTIEDREEFEVVEAINNVQNWEQNDSIIYEYVD